MPKTPSELSGITRTVFDRIDMFFPMCDGRDLNPEQRVSLAKWIVQAMDPTTELTRDEIEEAVDTLVDAAQSDPDPVSIYFVGDRNESEQAVIVVKGAYHVEYLKRILVGQRLCDPNRTCHPSFVRH